ncbi:protein IRREGULAR XYLEM 15-like [Oryza brachyantha]|uniref:protein IRREGULAR XYLEM 15-like n=1 Tax=Oryza brachyantha TaxID=4533 RepID=UPI001ADA04A0|nr:protein IRREGULAR XYLEM 15-like [Oryza brachyantha]
MKGLSGPKLLVVHPSSNKTVGGAGSAAMAVLGSRRRMWAVLFLAGFACVSLGTMLCAARDHPAPPVAGRRMAVSVSAEVGGGGEGGGGGGRGGLPGYVFDALVQYAAAAGNSTASMPGPDVRAIAAVLKRRAPCNLLVFGLGGETPLWRALNYGGRTVFLDENQYYVSHLEGRHPGLEAYDVVYTTTVREFPDLLDAARAARSAECRPVQNLLYSDCRLAINDLPNHLYDVAWDIILVDGPRGYTASSPGRMSAIFTAGVLARTRAEHGAETDVLVHDYEREVERACSREFLCEENRVEETSTRSLAHFVVPGGAAARREAFCAAAANAATATTQ